MPIWKAVGAVVGLTFVNLNVATCRSPVTEPTGEPGPDDKPKIVKLEGVDTSKLTARELKEWSSYVSELLAPCPDQPVSLAQCVQESRKCAACLPAARFLLSQVTRGRPRSQAEKAFRIRFSADTVEDVSVGDSPLKGAADAPVVIVEWADFECPFCGAASPVLHKTVKKFPGYLKLVFKHYPLSAHEHSEGAARAAVAAGKQGKFWEMHSTLFANQGAGLERKHLTRLARGIGLDMRRFTADLDSEEVADAVAKDRKQADKIGLRGTPMIYINGRLFDLEQFNLIEDLDPWIQLEIFQRTGKKVEPKKIAEEAADTPDPKKADAP